MDKEIIIFIIKLISGGLVSFMSIALMSKIREVSWAFIVAGFLLSYTAMVIELLVKLGILTTLPYTLWSIPLLPLICATLPSLCFLIGFILMFCKK